MLSGYGFSPTHWWQYNVWWWILTCDTEGPLNAVRLSLQLFQLQCLMGFPAAARAIFLLHQKPAPPFEMFSLTKYRNTSLNILLVANLSSLVDAVPMSGEGRRVRWDFPGLFQDPHFSARGLGFGAHPIYLACKRKWLVGNVFLLDVSAALGLVLLRPTAAHWNMSSLLQTT